MQTALKYTFNAYISNCNVNEDIASLVFSLQQVSSKKEVKLRTWNNVDLILSSTFYLSHENYQKSCIHICCKLASWSRLL